MRGHTKPYELTVEDRDDYLSVTLSADTIDHLTVLDYLSEIAVTCAKWHTRALLIERNIPMVLSDEEMLDSWGVFLKTRAHMRVALVNPHPKLKPALGRMIEAADPNTVKAVYFEDVADAERWIESDIP